MTKGNGTTSGTKCIRLITNAGVLHDTFEIPSNKNLPDVVIWGVFDKQRVFVRDRHNVYKEASWLEAPMPPMSGF